ncbi:hypothetical protein GCM10011533_11400 [Streptosporangium jomthongense]|nr:hypothetical protein GCM10011533_11400 [Streptosporangium jomthongense]
MGAFQYHLKTQAMARKGASGLAIPGKPKPFRERTSGFPNQGIPVPAGDTEAETNAVKTTCCRQITDVAGNLNLRTFKARRKPLFKAIMGPETCPGNTR